MYEILDKIKWPDHISISHNDQKSVYETVAGQLHSRLPCDANFKAENFTSLADMHEAVKTNDVWALWLNENVKYSTTLYKVLTAVGFIAEFTPEDLQELVRVVWPRHISMYIEHNEHISHNVTIEEVLSDADMLGGMCYTPIDFVDRPEIDKSIATNSVWTIQWYPDTPVGFCRLHAATLSKALVYTLKTE